MASSFNSAIFGLSFYNRICIEQIYNITEYGTSNPSGADGDHQGLNSKQTYGRRVPTPQGPRLEREYNRILEYSQILPYIATKPYYMQEEL